jgi:hypothetical protein
MPELEHTFIELLTFAGVEEILALVNRTNVKDGLGLPVWARNLAFRLAVLQRPADASLLRRASDDLFLFGPDWDGWAAAYGAAADALEGQREAE